MKVKEMKEILAGVNEEHEIVISLSDKVLNMLAHYDCCAFEPKVGYGGWDGVVEIQLGKNIMR